MWAGGRMTWYNDNPLIIGHKASASSTLATIEKKGFDAPHKTPMIFVSQKIDFTMEGKKDPSVVEERSHVYLSNNADADKGIRAGVIVHDFIHLSPP
jgi:hydroxyacyl-ACP dehydratase HTD2-like protein with hotdog domain